MKDGHHRVTKGDTDPKGVSASTVASTLASFLISTAEAIPNLELIVCVCGWGTYVGVCAPG